MNVEEPQLDRNFVSKTMKTLRSCTSLLVALCPVSAFQAAAPWRRIVTTAVHASGEGGDSEWSKALFENSGDAELDANRKLQGLLGDHTNPKLSANALLVDWLSEKGDVYLSDASAWGEAPHPMAISTDTKDEITNESSGRGLLARRDVSDGDELFQIPLKLCLTKATARSAMPVLDEEINEYLAIACLLIKERAKGKSSKWFPYLNVLPTTEEVSPTFTWSDDDLRFLEGSPVVAATQSLQTKLHNEYQRLLVYGDGYTPDRQDVSFDGPKNGLLHTHPDVFPEDVYTMDAWTWAFTMLFSRAIRLRSLRAGETLALVPYADLINHSCYSQAYIDARETGDWLFKSGEEEVILYADRRYRRMEQIYISYGPKSNAELLLLYGFAVERNPYNSVDVTVSIAPRTAKFVAEFHDDSLAVDPLAEEKRAFVEASGRDNTVDFPCYADRYPVEMLQYLRLMQMTEDDTRGTPLDQFDFTRTISTANEAAVLSSVVAAVTRQLSRYPQTEQEDAAIIKDKALFKLLNYHQRSAVRHRRNEKRLLKRTIAALSKQMVAQGLVAPDLDRAEGNTLGQLLPGDERKYGFKQKTMLEDKLEKLGLPVDLR